MWRHLRPGLAKNGSGDIMFFKPEEIKQADLNNSKADTIIRLLPRQPQQLIHHTGELLLYPNPLCLFVIPIVHKQAAAS